MTDAVPGPPRPDDAVPTPDPLDLPPDVPRSPTGRVPQWVLDEAAGRPSEPVPFRSWQPTPPARARRRGTALVAMLLVVALGAGALLWFQRGGATSPAALLVPRTSPLATSPGGASPSPGTTGSTTTGRTQAPPAGFEESPRPASLPLADLRQPTSRAYVFVARQKDKRTGVAWSPCRPVHWVLRGTSRAPTDGQRLLTEAFARVSALTGLTLVEDGTTTEKYSDRRRAYQPKRYGDRWAPVLVSWSTTSEDRGLRGDVLGRAGPQWVVTGSGDRAYVSGSVSLDAAGIEAIRRSRGEDVARAVILHELGHLVGLAHVLDRSSLMYPRVGPQVEDFSRADRRGLAALGAGPCQPDV